LFHFDLYRLENDCKEALEGIGYEDYFYANGVCLVEWAERAREIMPENTAWVSIAERGGCREITVYD
jgi:tRNA threonylcarbamoyladenosine biosynthesis protein TsaE